MKMDVRFGSGLINYMAFLRFGNQIWDPTRTSACLAYLKCNEIVDEQPWDLLLANLVDDHFRVYQRVMHKIIVVQTALCQIVFLAPNKCHVANKKRIVVSVKRINLVSSVNQHQISEISTQFFVIFGTSRSFLGSPHSIRLPRNHVWFFRQKSDITTSLFTFQ